MNKKKKLLTVVTLVILMLEASVFTVSAADNHSVDENTTYVTNFAELEKALEATSRVIHSRGGTAIQNSRKRLRRLQPAAPVAGNSMPGG